MRTYTLLALLLISVPLFAQKADLFTYDREKVDSELAQVSGLENNLGSNPNYILTESDFKGGFWIGITVGLVGSTVSGCFIGALPGFIVGSVLGTVATLIVYLKSKDNAQAGYAALGCLVGSGIGLGLIYTLVAVMRAAGYN